MCVALADPANRANFAKSANYAIRGKSSGTVLAEFELVLIDFQGLDPGRKSGWWNSKFDRRSGRTRNPASTVGKRRLDDLPLASRPTLNL